MSRQWFERHWRAATSPRRMARPADRPRGRQPQHQALHTRMRAAKLRHVGAAVEDVDYRSPRKLDKALFQKLASGRCIAEKRNLLITGPAGSARPGSPARLARRPAATIAPSSTSGCRGSSPQVGPADPRRLGSRPAHCQPTARPHRDRRGPIRRRLHAHHQPASRRRRARSRRRTDLCRRHPRPPRSQRIPARPRRTLDAQENWPRHCLKR